MNLPQNIVEIKKKIQEASEPPQRQNSQKERLLNMLPVEAAFWCDQNENGGVSLPENGYSVHYHIQSGTFRDWFLQRFFHVYQSSPSESALKEAIATLNARSRFGSTQRVISYHRAGLHDGKVYIHLAGEDGQQIEISAEGWRITHNSAVKLIRSTQMKPLPIPQRGGSVNALKKCLRLDSEASLYLLVGFLLQSLYPVGPFPLLAVTGEQGSGKTSLCRIISELIDPSASAIRALPKKGDCPHEIVVI
jgi:hypothetical protein